jgi:MFS transporter, PAT family, beta-lactamase induction signal transducer AmpG
MSNSDTANKKKSVNEFFERSSLVMFGLGFAAGMPNQLAGGSVLGIWLRESGLDLKVIALMGLATLTYALKFLWAPIVDRVAIPILDERLGRRRSWMLVTQIAVMIGLFVIASSDPAKNIWPTALTAVFIAFAGATQDITIDAWRIEVSQNDEKLGVLTATYQWGYRVAVLVAGAAPLFIAQGFNGNEYNHLGWGVAYGVMAALMGLPILATLLAPREKVAPAARWVAPAHIPDRPALEALEWLGRGLILALGGCFIAAGLIGRHEPISWLIGDLYGGIDLMKKSFEAKPWGVWQQVGYAILGLFMVFLTARPIPGVETKAGAYFHSALGEPLEDFFKRFENTATVILVFICVYRIAEFLLSVASTMYFDAGFTKDEIGVAQKFFGAFASAVGAGLAGWGITRFGLFKCLVIGAFSQPLSHIPFLLICHFGNTQFPFFHALHIQPMLWTAIGIDNVSAMFAGTCLVVYMSRLTKAGFTATQYALFSSLYALPGKLLAALSGRVVEGAALASHDGWSKFLTPYFSNLPEGSFAAPALKLGVTPEALATGYAVFFLYTVAMGVFGVAMAFVVSRGSARAHVEHND